MTSLLTRRTSAPKHRDVPVYELLVGVLALVAFIAVQPAIRSPRMVHRITIDNPTQNDLDVAVASSTNGPWLDAATLTHGKQAVVEEVVDQGGTWVVRFTAAGETGGDLVITRADLRGGGWHLQVPASVGSRLSDAGVTPPPD
jgi:hypothetical protein